MRENEIRRAFEEYREITVIPKWMYELSRNEYARSIGEGDDEEVAKMDASGISAFFYAYKSRDKEITALQEALTGATLMNEKLKKELKLYKGMVV